MSATKIRLTAVIMDVLDVLTSSPSDNPAWGLRLCEQTGHGTGTIYPALDRLMKAGWITDRWEDPPPADRPRRRFYEMTSTGLEQYAAALRARRRTPCGMASSRSAHWSWRMSETCSTASPELRPTVTRHQLARRQGTVVAAFGVALGASLWIMNSWLPWTTGLDVSIAGLTVSCAALGILMTALMIRASEIGVDRPLARFSVRGLTGLAALLAGRTRPVLRDEWRAHLAGESGHDPVTWQKGREARGFVASAIRFRCSDAAEAAWTPVDAILKSRTLSNLFVLAPTWAAAYLVLRHEGTLGVVKEAESIGTIGGTLYGLVRVGRWWRDVKPQEPKARRVKE